jgi:hypothetical protein
MVTLTNNVLKQGQAFISVGRNRLKQYDKNTVYLENGKEFQIELFNQKTNKVLAKIKMNGNYISSSGIVLKPGQRVFIERFLDEAKKFKFETYNVENSKETIEAVAKNGLVEIEFYDEYVAPQYYNYPFFYGLGSTCTIGNSINYTSTNTTNINSTINSNNSSLNCYSVSVGESTFETGRVEGGSTSNQSFTYDDSTYNSWTSNVVTWKILPISQKPYETEDLIKRYCGSCGKKITKTTWRFCPSCGEKLD